MSSRGRSLALWAGCCMARCRLLGRSRGLLNIEDDGLGSLPLLARGVGI